MTTKEKVKFCLWILVGGIFIVLAMFNWNHLHQIEMGEKEGSLSFFLYKIYEVAGKWGVAGFYMIFAVLCIWRAQKVLNTKAQVEEGKDEIEDKKNKNE